ncbi:hypothetical protein [Mycobacterium parmense]|uniref:Uncharacterized protein n=1 Tax=Mycobacterium parmense TaxID=185642 RepID=A0A7I7YU21_9MYCO|nr:hypothetical protein [Mycobacterium parmense]MCV7351838.1 hypothetical protein [Mycobacterium parmense]ORW56755.1 hypothetical protein AWC20_02680 [Mycobacterium parmense]BBZ44692.1 hypothetical protein MPRM_19730 [Mycobacterium parmense]
MPLNWSDAPRVHPRDIRVGDLIGTLDQTEMRYTVKLIGEPQKNPKQWTFFGRDDNGRQHTGTFRESDMVCRYAKRR